MNKKNIKILIIAIVVLFIFALTVLVTTKTADNNKDSRPVELMTADEIISLNLYHLGVYEVMSRDASGKIVSYRFLHLEDAKPIELEWMTDAEKTERGLNLSMKAQILRRDSGGKIVKYNAKFNKIQPLRG